MLEVERLSSGYGKLKVLHDISLSVHEREIVVILGANGAGKSTLLRTLSGLVAATSGSARFEGEELVGQAAHRLARGRESLTFPKAAEFSPSSRSRTTSSLVHSGGREDVAPEWQRNSSECMACFQSWPNAGVSAQAP